MNEIFHNNTDNQADVFIEDEVFQSATLIEPAASECSFEDTSTKQESQVKRSGVRWGVEHPNWNQDTGNKIDQAIIGLTSGHYNSLGQASIDLGYHERWLGNLGRRRPDIAKRLQEARSTPEFKAAHAAIRSQDLLKRKAAAAASGRDKDAPWRRRHMASIKEAVEGLKKGRYGNLAEASIALGFNKDWLSQTGKRNPAVAEMIKEACISPAFKTAVSKNKEKRKAQNSQRAKSSKEINMASIKEAVEGLRSGRYGGLIEASIDLGFGKAWLSQTRKRNPAVAEIIEEACTSPAFKAAVSKNKEKRKAQNSQRAKSLGEINMASIKEAVEELRSGRYGSMPEAGIALGFGEAWLTRAKKRNPMVAEMIEEACTSPAFKAAVSKNKEKRKAQNSQRAKSLEKVNQAIAGLASGGYDNMRQASLALGFNSRWLYEKQCLDPEIAERLREINAKTSSRQSTARKQSTGSKSAKGPAKSANSNSRASTNKTVGKTKPRRSKTRNQAAQRPAATPAPESDASLISNSNSVLRWNSDIDQMSATRKAIKIINFWEGDVTVEEVIVELQELGVNTEQQDIREQIISLLERKSRYFQAKH